jgi:hypothetical protein
VLSPAQSIALALRYHHQWNGPLDFSVEEADKASTTVRSDRQARQGAKLELHAMAS